MLLVRLRDVHETREFAFSAPAVSIGSAADNDLTLSAPDVLPFHATLSTDAEGNISVSNGETSYRLAPGEPLIIGKVRLDVRHEALALTPDAEEEQRFLAALAERPDDDDTRAVYADWLEQAGATARAEFLRAQRALRSLGAEDPAFAPATARLRQLAASVSVAWRARVAMTRLERHGACGSEDLGFELACPLSWEKLAPTAEAGVRRCDVCREEVLYCSSIDMARTHASAGGCVAVDIAVERQPEDLWPRRLMMLGRPSPDIASRRGGKQPW